MEHKMINENRHLANCWGDRGLGVEEQGECGRLEKGPCCSLAPADCYHEGACGQCYQITQIFQESF